MTTNSKLIKRALQEIDEITRPMVILINTTGEISSRLHKSLEDKLWNEMSRSFRFVRQTALYSLEDDIQDFLNRPADSEPIVLRMEPDDFFQQTAMEILLERMFRAGIRNVVVLCLISPNRPNCEDWIISYISRGRLQNMGLTITPIVLNG